MGETRLVLDIGPGLLQLLLGLPVMVASIAAAVVSIRNGQKIDAANSTLAKNLVIAASARAASDAPVDPASLKGVH